jgi:predicted ATPase
MESIIRSLILKRFRSIPASKVDFDNPTFLVGHNGSGKSNLVDAFAFLSEAMASPLQAVFDRRGGISAVRNRSSSHSAPPKVGLGVLFGRLNGQVQSGRYAFEVRALPNYGFEVVREQCLVLAHNRQRYWFDREKDDFRSNVQGLKPSLDRGLLVLPAVAGDARLAPVLRSLAGMRVYRIEPGKLREMQDPDGGTSLRCDGSNATSVLQEVERQSPDDTKRICEILTTIVPNTKKVRATKHGNKLSLEFTQEWSGKKRLHFEAFSMSDGTLRAVGLLLAVFQHPTPTVIIVEEPEATIHPGALGAILDVLRIASLKTQVVVTTHSPEVLDAEWIKHSHLRIVAWDEGATKIAPISASSTQALQDHLMGAGELLRSNALQPAPSLFTDVVHDHGQMELFEDIR